MSGMSLEQAKSILDEASKNCDAVRARVGGVVAELSEAKTKLSAVAGAGFALTQVMQALGAIEGATKALQEAGQKAGIAGQMTRNAISGGNL